MRHEVIVHPVTDDYPGVVMGLSEAVPYEAEFGICQETIIRS